MDFATTLTSISTALTITKQLKDIDKDLDGATYKLQISELMSTLADVKIDLSEAKILLDDKDNEITELKNKIAFKAEKTVSHGGYTYLINEDGEPQKYPYCPSCEQRGIYLILQFKNRMTINCPGCNSEYNSRQITSPDNEPEHPKASIEIF